MGTQTQRASNLLRTEVTVTDQRAVVTFTRGDAVSPFLTKKGPISLRTEGGEAVAAVGIYVQGEDLYDAACAALRETLGVQRVELLKSAHDPRHIRITLTAYGRRHHLSAFRDRCREPFVRLNIRLSPDGTVVHVKTRILMPLLRAAIHEHLIGEGYTSVVFKD